MAVVVLASLDPHKEDYNLEGDHMEANQYDQVLVPELFQSVTPQDWKMLLLHF